jgi:hypothetical protein
MAGASSAAVPALFKGASLAARGLAPKAADTAFRAAGLRTGQAIVKGAPTAALSAAPISTLVSKDTTEAQKVEAGATLAALLGLPAAQLYKGTKRIGAERAGSIAEQAELEGRRVIGQGEAKRGAGKIAEQRALEAETEASRTKAAEKAVAEQRKAETKAYEESIGLETGKELQSRAAAKRLQDIETSRRLAEEARIERRAAQDVLEQNVEQVKDTVRQARMSAEDQALTDAQQRNDVATEARLWEQKNKRAQRAVKDEQRVIFDAERLARGDQAAVAEMQAQITELKAMEDALTTGDDPSLRGAIAKKYQDMGNRLERALKFFKDGGVEPPPEYQQAYDSVRESYLRNTQAQGYVGFGPSNELFLEDPKAWAESERLRRLSKVETDRTGKEAAIVRFLEGIAQRDYMAEARTTRAGPQVPEARIRELFADQGLEYGGGPLVDQSGVRINQPLFGNRTPRAPFTSPEAMQQSIARRRQLQGEVEASRVAIANLKRSQGRVQTAAERKALEQQAALQAQQAAGFSGLTERQAIEQAVRGRMPAPAGLPEADILARMGISPAPAAPVPEADILQAANVTPAEAARLLAEQRAAARNRVTFGTTTPTARTQREIDPESTGRALWETVVPEWVQGGVRLVSNLGGRISGSNIAPRSLPEFTRRTSPTLSTESRMSTPFEALELASSFQRALETDSAFAQGFRRFLDRSPGGTWFGYLRTDPVARAKVEAERQAAAEGAAP